MVKSAYLALHNLRFGSNMVEEFKCLWKNKIPHKVSFLIWRVLHDRLPTTRITYIKDVHIQFLDDGLACVPCGHVVEDSYHVFFFSLNLRNCFGGDGMDCWTFARYPLGHLLSTSAKFLTGYKDMS